MENEEMLTSAERIVHKRVQSLEYHTRMNKIPEHKAKRNKLNRERKQQLKYEVFMHYSGIQPKCACCGFADMRALCLDHINENGVAHRLSISKGKSKSRCVYSDVKQKGFPAGFQVLCFNCNIIKYMEYRKPNAK